MFEFKTFVASFTTDYNTLGALSEIDSEHSVQVWISLGRDQAQIVRDQVANKFTPEYGVSVDLKLVAGGSLLPSVLAGVGPGRVPRTRDLRRYQLGDPERAGRAYRLCGK